MSSIAINKKINDNRVSLLKVGKKARIVIYAFMAICSILVLLPLLWLILTSMKTQAELTQNILCLPNSHQLSN